MDCRITGNDASPCTKKPFIAIYLPIFFTRLQQCISARLIAFLLSIASLQGS